jgi:hypothetical protein
MQKDRMKIINFGILKKVGVFGVTFKFLCVIINFIHRIETLKWQIGCCFYTIELVIMSFQQPSVSNFHVGFPLPRCHR